VHNFTRECQSHWRKNFLQHVRYVATIPCESVRHKSNTFHTILALCTCLNRSHLRKPVSMKQKKTHQKVRGSKFPPFMRTQETHAFKRLRHCAIAAMMMFWSCTSTPLAQQTFFQLLHIKDPRTVDPLLNVVHRILIWPHLQRDKI